jgi:regulatory protein
MAKPSAEANIGKIDFESARAKIAKYCAYQERSHYEVEQKLFSYGLFSSQVDDIIAWLITNNYLNEERFAIAFAGGKFRIKKWGKVKIRKYLAQKKVSEYSINKALMLLDKKEYYKVMEELIQQKWRNVNAENIYELRNKVARYVIAKGFEAEEVWPRIKTIIN